LGKRTYPQQPAVAPPAPSAAGFCHCPCPAQLAPQALMNGPSARALREGGIGGSIPYKIGVTLVVKLASGGPLPPEWRRKTTLQEPFGDYGQILRIDCQEAQGVAFIEFEDKRDAEDAEHEMNGKQISGKIVSVTLARAPDQRRGVGPGRTVDIEERIAELARRHRLDEAATARLASVFHDRSRLGCDLSRDFEELNEHLAASNKPSALVSMKLADLRAGRSIGPCKYAGSGARRGMCEADEVFHIGNGSILSEARSFADNHHNRDEGRSRDEARGRELKERRHRSRDRTQASRPEERREERDERTEERGEEKKSQKRSWDRARSSSHYREKSHDGNVAASPQRSREEAQNSSCGSGVESRQHKQRSLPPRQSQQDAAYSSSRCCCDKSREPKRGTEHCRSGSHSSSEARKRPHSWKEQDVASSKSCPQERKARDDNHHQRDGCRRREKPQSSSSSSSGSSSRHQDRKAQKADGPKKSKKSKKVRRGKVRSTNQQQQQQQQQQQHKKSDSSSSGSTGGAAERARSNSSGHRRLRGSAAQRRKAKSRSPSSRRRKKSRSSSSNESD